MKSKNNGRGKQTDPPKKEKTLCSPMQKLIAVCSALLLFLSFIFILCAYVTNRFSHLSPTDVSLSEFVAFADGEGKVRIVSAENGFCIELDEEGTVSDLTLSAKKDKIFYIVHENESKTLCSRTLSALVFKREVIGEHVLSYSVNRTADKIVYLSTGGSLYLVDTRSGAEQTEIAGRVSEYHTSDSGDVTVYCAKNESGRSCVYSFDGNESELLYENAEIVDINDNAYRVTVSSVNKLVSINVKDGSSSILSESFGSLEAVSDGCIYYSVRGEDGLSSLYCHDGSEFLISNRVSGIPFKSDAPFLVYSEPGEDGDSEEYFALVRSVSSRISGHALSEFCLSTDGGTFFYNDASREQEILIKASVTPNGLSDFSVVDTDVAHVCGTVRGKVVYVKNFNPITGVSDLYCGGIRIRTGVSMNEYTHLPDYVPPIRTYTWVHTGIVSTGYVCRPIRGSEALIYSADGKIFTFDGKDERDMCIGELSGAYPISEELLLCGTSDSITVSREGKLTEKKYTFSHFIYIKPYGVK